MNPTDPAMVFADLLLPLKQANLRRHISYFPHGADASQSYWVDVATRTGGVTQVPAGRPEADPLHGLATYWAARGDTLLARTLPELRQLQAALLAAPDQQDEARQTVSDFVYPLF